MKRYSIKFLIFFSTFVFTPLHAGLTALTFHSRANCANNETISWHFNHLYLLRTVSYHYLRGVFQHEVDTGRQATWRSAAVHWGEGLGGWTVHGEHWGVNQFNDLSLLKQEIVYDCSIYDGWWDH